MTNTRSAHRPEPDKLLVEIADYVCDYTIASKLAVDTARYCLLDSLACGFLALKYPACTTLLGPSVPGAILASGVPIPGTAHTLEPVQAAFNLGCMIRWLDFNDTWLAAEWGHPSDNLGGILAATDFRSRNNFRGLPPLTVGDVLNAAIKAHEIQGVLALQNSFNRVGLDHVLLVRVASTAVITHLLGGDKDSVINAVSQAWLDGGALRTYRHAPNTGPRKSWAAGDATSRAVRLALITLAGEIGYPTAISAKGWGFSDVLFGGNPIVLQQALGTYVMENILFKIAFPAEFHAQTAVEAALALHPIIKDRLSDIEKVLIETQEAGVRIIDKTGPLHNPADRDHCIQYVTAIGLIFGELTADHYEDDVAGDSRVDALRDKMEVVENKQFSIDYMDADKRSIANAVQVHFKDGSSTERIEVAYPVGHKRRREEGIPLLLEKFNSSLNGTFAKEKSGKLYETCRDESKLDAMRVDEFMDLWRTNG